ncbi:hypothetical protein HYT01_03175 [Candidatus Giovannonibacteria bacterium]|nr:hypothetical protein [Candidatus Giovannonibacteria bacterium]
MVLFTHAIVGTAVAGLFPAHPVAGFAAGFISHFALDAIPHWHYPLGSLTQDKNDPMKKDMVWSRPFFYDLLKISLDGGLGAFLSLEIFYFVFMFLSYLFLPGCWEAFFPTRFNLRIGNFPMSRWRPFSVFTSGYTRKNIWTICIFSASLHRPCFRPLRH